MTRYFPLARRALVVGASVAMVLGILPRSLEAQNLPEPPPKQSLRWEEHPGGQIPLDLTFKDETGKTVKLGDYFGSKPVVLSLVYFSCPMLCPMTLQGLADSLKQLRFDIGKDYNVLTVSFDPHDTPKVAAQKRAIYLARYGRPKDNSGWHFLTGDQKEIHQLTEAVGFHYVYNPKKKQFAHPTGVVVLTPKGKIGRYFFGIDYSPVDLRLGIVDASHGKVGGFVDQVLLLCCTYNPQTGKYDGLAYNLMRGAGALTLLIMATIFFIMWLRYRARKNSTSTGAD